LAKNPKSVVYVVGAGLSAGLGFPTVANLLPALWPRLAKSGIAAEIADVIRFHHPDFNAARNETFPTIERLLSEIKANLDLFDSTRPSVGGFTRDDLMQRRSNLLAAVASWFHELKRAALNAKPAWLTHLAEAMRAQDANIISFNWDLVLDELLFGPNLDKSSYGFDRRKKGPRLIKPHGSLNWYRGNVAGPLKESRKFKLAGTGANETFAFRPLRAPISKRGRRYEPLIVPPEYGKQFDGPLFQRLWQESVRVLSTATEVRFLGYSMAEADFHARFVLRCGFFGQEDGELRDDGSRAEPTGRAKVVIVDPSDEPFARIHEAVGWECEFRQKVISDWIDEGGLV
jgi:hypothetical protein